MRLMKEQPSDDMILERLDEMLEIYKNVLSPVSHVNFAGFIPSNRPAVPCLFSPVTT